MLLKGEEGGFELGLFLSVEVLLCLNSLCPFDSIGFSLFFEFVDLDHLISILFLQNINLMVLGPYYGLQLFNLFIYLHILLLLPFHRFP